MRRRPLRGLRAAALAALGVAAAGCVDDLVRQVVPIPAGDGPVRFTDARPGGEAAPPPGLAITDVTPGHGPFTGGTTVVIAGADFSGGLEVRFGGVPVEPTRVKVLSPVSAEVIAPPGEVGPADVELTLAGQQARLPGGYRYDPVELDPAAGPTAGGTLVTLRGRGTSFTPQMSLTLGGEPMTGVEVISATILRARTPAAPIGPADLVFTEGGAPRRVPEAFTYYAAANPKEGGMGGGPIQGTLTVSVLSWLDRSPVPGARVVVQRARELELTGTTDAGGAVVFAAPDLHGPVTVTAGKVGFETSTLVQLDARDVTVFLMPIIKPQPGPLPPGTQGGRIKGHVLFGGTTGAGSTQWKLVPAPKADQIKRTYVYATVPSIQWGPPSANANATIDYTADGTTAWPFSLVTYAGGVAIYAVSGLYHQGTGQFDPYAMGVTRGIVVGPGETVQADVWVNIPLTESLGVEVPAPPPAAARHSLALAVDLGADGLILTRAWTRAGTGAPPRVDLNRLPALSQPGLVDATFTVDLIVEHDGAGGRPVIRAVERAVRPPPGTPIVLDDLVGAPLQVTPPAGGVLQGNTLVFRQTGAPHDLAVTVLQSPDETPIWRVISPGAVTRVQLPDPPTLGLPAWPSGPVVWLQWLARVPGLDFDSYNYGHLSSRYWSRWSFDELGFEVP